MGSPGKDEAPAPYRNGLLRVNLLAICLTKWLAFQFGGNVRFRSLRAAQTGLHKENRL